MAGASSAPAANLTLAIACGGTGGHFYPGLTVAHELRRQGGTPILFIGGHHQAEQLQIARKEGFAAVASPAVRLPANKLWLPVFAAQFAWCVARNVMLLRRHRVQAALAMGSFACAPMGFAAAFLRRPLVLHEGNSLLGAAHRRLGRYAKALCLSFPLAQAVATRAPQHVVGMPVRDAFLQAAEQGFSAGDRATVLAELGLQPDLPVLMVFGGSQGAQALNDTLRAMVAWTAGQPPRFQLIHLTGKDDNTEFVVACKKAGCPAAIKTRDSHIERLLLTADLVVCRAGASSIFELALLGRPTVLVPFPQAAEDHQTRNAEFVVKAGGALLIPQTEFTPERLVQLVDEWLAEPARFQELGHCICTLARPRAAAEILDHCRLKTTALGSP